MRAMRFILVEVKLPVVGSHTQDLADDIQAAEQDLWFALRHFQYTIEAAMTQEIK